MAKKIINSFYECFISSKGDLEKPKIICDWDEVIQAYEPYAAWKATEKKNNGDDNFPAYFREFWKKEWIKYFSYGSKLSSEIKGEVYWEDTDLSFNDHISTNFIEKQQRFKNSPSFYKEAPFLTIAENLLNLIRENKIKEIIFLSAYDKRKFLDGDTDTRKHEIFNSTFAKLNSSYISLQLIGFDSEEEGTSKADWIKTHAFDFDLVIDDNPNICKQILEAKEKVVKMCKECEELVKENDISELTRCRNGECFKMKMKVIAPHYPSVENQHHEKVLLINNSVSNLKKEDFIKKI